MRNKDIADAYGVSPSYISKLKRGRKTIDVPVKPLENGLELDTIEHVQTQIRIHTHQLAIYIELLRKYRGEK